MSSTFYFTAIGAYPTDELKEVFLKDVSKVIAKPSSNGYADILASFH